MYCNVYYFVALHFDDQCWYVDTFEDLDRCADCAGARTYYRPRVGADYGDARIEGEHLDDGLDCCTFVDSFYSPCLLGIV